MGRGRPEGGEGMRRAGVSLQNWIGRERSVAKIG